MIAGKTLDDRALVACMFRCAEILASRKLECSVVLCASTQEECGGPGAGVGAYSVEPDMAIILDVSHADQPGADSLDVCAIDKIAVCRGAIYTQR